MGERNQRIVIALGGSALSASQSPSSEQLLAEQLVHHLHPVLLSGIELVVTHSGLQLGGGFGNSVGAPKVTLEPRALDAMVATSEGALGDVLATSLREELNDARPVAALLTHVRVDGASAGFRRPRRPAGPVLNEARARLLRKEGLSLVSEPHGRGYRRLVPEVEPLEVLDVAIVKRLIESGVVVVAGGGGGIPVIREGRGWRGAEAVVDQDLTAALLADSIDADQLFIVTDVSNVFEDFGTSHEEPIGLINVDELRNLLAEGHFVPRTMAPKVEACVRFVSRPGRRAVICDATNLEQAMAGLAGTRVIWTTAATRDTAFEHHVASSNA